MSGSKYIKTHSNYTIKEKHQDVTNGAIFERDFMTISEMSSYTPGQTPIYGETNFKMTINNGINGQKKYTYGSWDKSECGDVWTLDCITNPTITSETKVELKRNYNSIKDFAYYGSATELVKNTLINIINKFPAELYLTNINYEVFDINGNLVNLGGDNAYIVENPFNIDITTNSIVNNVVDNSLRYLCDSYHLYEVVDGDNNIISDNILWEVTYNNINCPTDGDILTKINLGNNIILYNIYYDGDILLMHTSPNTNIHIRPKITEINNYFNNLSDFEAVLLNRNSVPQYKSILTVIEDTELGPIMQNESFVYPTRNKWNLDINSVDYSIYVSKLQTMSEYYDEKYSDNLWRMYTHTSIKNFDNFIIDDDNYASDIILGEGIIENLIRIYGRQFDDIKKYIDNIKTVNTITYDNKNNTPNYFLTDVLNDAGWEVITPSPTTNNNIDILKPYSGLTGIYTSSDADNLFFSKLKLNSKFLLQSKGTIKGLRMLFSLLGMDYNTDYEFNEQIAIVTDGYDNIDDVEKYNMLKDNYIASDYETDNTYQPLQGLPVKEVIYSRDDSGTIIEDRYIIPWFDKDVMLDGSPYFQMKGGWGKIDSKAIKLDIATGVDRIYGDIIYNETDTYINIAQTLTDLIELPLQILNDGDVYYVNDITDFNIKYPSFTGTPSNFFILQSTLNSNEMGDNGWKCISNEEIKDGTSINATKILYIESIIDSTSGNNPHSGKGNYDMGDEYLELYKEIFKFSINTNNFTNITYNDLENLKKLGFTIINVSDNDKVWYFTNKDNDKYLLSSEDGITFTPQSIIPVKTEFVNPEGGEKTDEPTSNSIINTKLFQIIIKNDLYKNNTYFEDVIMHYIKQLIPSTTIWQIVYN